MEVWRSWRGSEVLEEVEGSGGSIVKLWRRQEALEAVEGSGGGRRVWRSGGRVRIEPQRSRGLEGVQVWRSGGLEVWKACRYGGSC
jgi:hypothetical protein